MGPSRVLVPLDGSPLAEEALAHALETFDCPVTVLNVVTPIDGSMSEGGVLEGEVTGHDAARERAEGLVADARREAMTVDESADGADRAVETAVESGDPAETILAHVEGHDVDHVVMGGHGGDRNAVARRLLGTVATTVVGEAPVTVTVIR